MNDEIEVQLNQYAEIFNAAKKLVKSNATAAALVGEVGKHLRMELIREQQERRFNGNNGNNGNGYNNAGGFQRNGFGDSPSKKQLDYLRDLGIAVQPGISRQEASRLIDEAKAQQ